MEWTTVTVIIAIVGLIGTVAVPLTKNTKAMTQLSERINHLVYRMEQDENDLTEFKNKAADRHRKIFDRLDDDQKKINQSRGQNQRSRNEGRKIMNNINWKVRLQNGAWWMGVISTALIAIFTVLDMCNIPMSVSVEEAINVARLILAVPAAIGVITDPTTESFGDSSQALTYETPKSDKTESEG